MITLLLTVGLTPQVSAQHAQLNDLEMRASGEAYAKSIRFRGIDRGVLYFDPTQPAPPLETSQPLQRDGSTDADGPGLSTTLEGGRLITLLIASMILLGVVYLFIVFGGRFPVSFSRNPDDGADGAKRPNGGAHNPQVPLAIDAVLQMKDRNRALVALCKGLLARAVAAEGVLLQDSWTDRDTLRRVPRSLAQRDALQALVFASEKVQFGGRDVSEDEFNGHVTRLKPLWTSQPA